MPSTTQTNCESENGHLQRFSTPKQKASSSVANKKGGPLKSTNKKRVAIKLAYDSQNEASTKTPPPNVCATNDDTNDLEPTNESLSRVDLSNGHATVVPEISSDLSSESSKSIEDSNSNTVKVLPTNCDVKQTVLSSNRTVITT